MPPKYTRAELLEELQSVATDLGRTPTAAEFRESGACSIGPYRRVFGSWNGALTAAGLQPRESPRYALQSVAVDREQYIPSPECAVRATEMTFRHDGRSVTLSFPLRVKDSHPDRITEGVFLVSARGDECWLLHFETETWEGKATEWWVPLAVVVEALERGDLEVNDAQI